MLDKQSVSISRLLHQRGMAAWAAATNHPMVREIGAGTLPHEKFRRYFEQNILYLEDYARAISLIIGKAPDHSALLSLTRFLSQIVENEIPANVRFLERLGGNPHEIDSIDTMGQVTYGYTRHLLHVTHQGDCSDGLTAVLPCQWSYWELAKPFAEALPDDPIYADWIRMFGDEEYNTLVRETTGLLDRLVDPNDTMRMRTLSWIFEISIRFEVEFWDMAYGATRQKGEIKE